MNYTIITKYCVVLISLTCSLFWFHFNIFSQAATTFQLCEVPRSSEDRDPEAYIPNISRQPCNVAESVSGRMQLQWIRQPKSAQAIETETRINLNNISQVTCWAVLGAIGSVVTFSYIPSFLTSHFEKTMSFRRESMLLTIHVMMFNLSTQGSLARLCWYSSRAPDPSSPTAGRPQMAETQPWLVNTVLSTNRRRPPHLTNDDKTKLKTFHSIS